MNHNKYKKIIGYKVKKFSFQHCRNQIKKLYPYTVSQRYKTQCHPFTYTWKLDTKFNSLKHKKSFFKSQEYYSKQPITATNNYKS